MEELYSILKSTLLICQFMACTVGAFYILKKKKKNYWKWFSIYLIIIFAQECFWFNNDTIDSHYRILYYTFFGVPLQYLFFYWLYALKSLDNKKLFFVATSVFLAAMISSLFFKTVDEIFSISSNVGAIMLMILVILEFIKQIKSDNILKFKENKMFYINLGSILFYVGTYPFHILGPELYRNYFDIWNMYYIYFLVTNCIMYLLFTASFVWGKTQ